MADRKKVKAADAYSLNASTIKNNKLRASKQGEDFMIQKGKNADNKTKKFLPRIQHLLDSATDENERKQLEDMLRIQSRNAALKARES
ncbi:hypothetical protein CC80DRAFT_555376 [Byssothecium circinans]|uniref:Uncharacterized protein n=1 Tax=Byssothecium circinans TaxID=147558 RepID=A0A6A5TCE8_9PLEO|nr:hypothetical protein CC80DRAFT_555376 [Byssothecium circinans]